MPALDQRPALLVAGLRGVAQPFGTVAVHQRLAGDHAQADDRAASKKASTDCGCTVQYTGGGGGARLQQSGRGRTPPPHRRGARSANRRSSGRCNGRASRATAPVTGDHVHLRIVDVVSMNPGTTRCPLQSMQHDVRGRVRRPMRGERPDAAVAQQQHAVGHDPHGATVAGETGIAQAVQEIGAQGRDGHEGSVKGAGPEDSAATANRAPPCLKRPTCSTAPCPRRP